MMKMKWILIGLIILVGSLTLYACNIPFTPTPFIEEVCEDCIIPLTCTASGLGVAGNLDPSNFEVVPLSPTLTWEFPSTTPSPYPYPSGSPDPDCPITGYQVYIAPFNERYNDLGGRVTGTSTSFTPSSPLEPHTWYFWQVSVRTAYGQGPWSGKHAFVTGPVCTRPALFAPEALAPSGTIHTLRPHFTWWGSYASASSCMPTGYHLELSTSSSFATTVASVDLSNEPSHSWDGWVPESDLEDCRTYYWRVAAKNDTEIGTYDNETFRTEVGLCLTLFIPGIEANCRIGPNPLYDRLGILDTGDPLPVYARHETQDAMWYKVELKNKTQCWVSDITGDLDGDPELIPFSDDFPPLPLDKPDNGPACSEITSSSVCDSTPGCSYNFNAKRCE